VFDIMQGVSINIFVKTGKKNIGSLGKLFFNDIQGKRDHKYEYLHGNKLSKVEWKELDAIAPNYYFINKNFTGNQGYQNGFGTNEIFTLNSSGIKTHRDHFVIDFDKNNLAKRIKEFYDLQLDEKTIARKLDLKDNRDWSISNSRQSGKYDERKISFYDYRPFDARFCYYDSNIIDFGRGKIMQHMIHPNWGLIVCKQQSSSDFQHVFLTKLLVDINSISLQTKEISYCLPLYLYPEKNDQLNFGETSARTPNLKPEIVNQIAENLASTFTPEKENTPGTFGPIDILDYIYAVLHSPAYREKYKEFLKIDFPRVPYPKDLTTFGKLSNLGSELRQIHLLESPVVDKYITQYPVDGDNLVTKIKYQDDKVYINDSQYFANVPEVAWNFYIGGYQPAQKWLKDRKDRKLDFDDILHYQKIIVALVETDRIMKEVDKVGVE